MAFRKVIVVKLPAAREHAAELLRLLADSTQPRLEVVSVAIDGPDGLAATALEQALRPAPAAIVLAAPALDEGTSVCLSLLRELARAPIVVAAESPDARAVMDVLRHGASDCWLPPFRSADLLPRLWRLVESGGEESVSVREIKERLGLQMFVGESPAFVAEISKIPLMSSCDASVLISGETGTGKEICARAIHYLSPRQQGPFVAVNCGAFPAELVENELFGHVAGAFTGAAQAKLGLVEEAHRGTLFLDEIDTLPAPAQVKFLRFLQEREFRPLGSTKTRRAEVRVIAASNRELDRAVQAGQLRKDLFYRLNVLALSLPPLRQRRGDIPLLARHFLKHYALAFRRTVSDLAPGALQKLLQHPWPGNVRELENIIERAVALAQHPTLTAADLDLPDGEHGQRTPSFRSLKARMIEQFERDYLQELLQRHHGNIAHAAREAQKNRRAFFELMRKHRVCARSFAAP